MRQSSVVLTESGNFHVNISKVNLLLHTQQLVLFTIKVLFTILAVPLILDIFVRNCVTSAVCTYRPLLELHCLKHTVGCSAMAAPQRAETREDKEHVV